MKKFPSYKDKRLVINYVIQSGMGVGFALELHQGIDTGVTQGRGSKMVF